MRIIDVTCGIILSSNKILVVQRGEKMKLPLKWEFPGGKIENGESEQACLIREIKEELNIEVKLITRLSPSKYNYSEYSINLIPYVSHFIKGNIKLSEHKQYLWLTKDKIESLDWADADIPIVKEFLSL